MPAESFSSADGELAAVDMSILRPLTRQIAKAFGLAIFLVETSLAEEQNARALAGFCSAGGLPKLLITKLPPPPDADPEEEELEPQLVASSGEADKSVERGVLLVKLKEGMELSTAADIDSCVSCSMVLGSPVKSLLATLEHVFQPVLSANVGAWAGQLPEEVDGERAGDFFAGLGKYVGLLSEAVNGIEGGIELVHPTNRTADNIELKPAAYARAAATPEIVASYEAAVTSWCDTVEGLNAAVPPPAEQVPEGDEGVAAEVEYWKGRLGKFMALGEQLRSREMTVVRGVLGQTRSPALRRWKTLETPMQDQTNEAKDNVKYLMTLEKYLDVLGGGTPAQIAEALPAFLQNVKMMYTISRYYASEERLSTLFCKLTNQLVVRCVAYLEAPGKLWTQPTRLLLERLADCLSLEESYRDSYLKMSESTRGGEKPALDLDEELIFVKLDAFVTRLGKLSELFATIQTFTELAAHGLDGIAGMLSSFEKLVESLKSKPYSLLAFTNAAFDADVLDFDASINDLEAALQRFINQSFETITSTEQALALLRRYQTILQRDALREDLDAKLTVVFHNYGIDLETSQLLYERNKESPPIARNAPPVAGNILWARQLLRRIEAPMAHFQESEQLMSTKESKKIVKTYNRIARTIVEFETLWHIAWGKSIDASKAGLQATLLVRHPTSGKLIVNFDREILLLIRETKCLMRMGVAVPDAARLVVMQEMKFKSFFNQLSYALRQYEKVLGRILPIVQPLLRPHVADMERRLEPGFTTLTWTSMNIDGFLHAMYSGVTALEDLIEKVKDIVDNRIERNLRRVANVSLVELPSDESYTLDKFVSVQEKLVRSQQAVIAAKNEEVEEAVVDLVELIAMHTLKDGKPAGVKAHEEARIRAHYSNVFYRAVLLATKAALKTYKKRIGSRASGGFLFVDRPIFDVNVELNIPHVNMSPPLEDVQAAINRSCRAILAIAKACPVWATPADKAANVTVFDRISADSEIIVMVLLLTGSMEGLKRQVFEYLTTFKQYDWLWQGSKETEFAAFMKASPTLAEYETKLKMYVDIEREISKIAPVNNIGALSLETAPLKYSLRSEAAAWKALFGNRVHTLATERLESTQAWFASMQRNLKREIRNLDDVRFAMTQLAEVRDRESAIDDYLQPVEDMFVILTRYEVNLGKDEIDQVGDLRYTWKKLLAISNEVSADLQRVQVDFKRDLIKNVRSFVGDVTQFRAAFETEGPMVPGLTPDEANERLMKFKSMYEQREKKFATYSAGEALFGLPTTDYPSLSKTKKELDLLDRLYSLYINVVESLNEWRELPWAEVAAEGTIKGIEGKVGDFQSACSRMPKELRQWDAYVELKRLIDDFVLSLPLVQQLAHPSMRPRHWANLIELTGESLPVGTDDFKMRNVLEAGLLDHRDEVEDIANSAVKELQIEEKLSAISDDWSDEQLSFANFKARGQITLQGGATGELMEKVEETLMALGSMLASRYVTPFKEGVQMWVSKLSQVSDVLEVWTQVQAMWQYLEAVFSGGDIAKQLPQESKRFQGIDKNWEKVMVKALETRNVVAYIYGNDMLQELLPHLLDQLEVCQKALSGYLDQKRASFPRFYFVSDPSLLEILSQGSNPAAIQPHLQSVFASVVSVEFDPANGQKIVTLFDTGGESIDLEKPVEMVGNIEEWLGKLLKHMQQAVNGVVRAASADCEALPLADFTHKYQAQVSLIGIQIKWTLDCEDALYRAKTEKGVMNATGKRNNQRLTDLVAINLKPDAELAVHGKWTRTKVETMILVDVHQRDVFDDMIKAKIKDSDHFEWQKQARFYFQHEKDVAQIAVADVDFDYCNEYLGVKERLVITPLTDRCYITLSQALGMCLGGAPAGPAGTGKTETVKDMGCTLGA